MPLRSVSQILNKTPQQSKYEDPRWNQKRLSVLRSKGDRRCESCGQTNIPVQVHHLYYEFGKEIWDYPDTHFRVLCVPCHKEWHELTNELRGMVTGCMRNCDLRVFVRSMGVGVKHYKASDIAYALAQMISEPETFKALLHRWINQK